MNDSQVLTIILSIGIPMLTGFGFIFMKLFRVGEQIHSLGERIARIEGLLSGRDFWSPDIKEKK